MNAPGTTHAPRPVNSASGPRINTRVINGITSPNRPGMLPANATHCRRAIPNVGVLKLHSFRAGFPVSTVDSGVSRDTANQAATTSTAVIRAAGQIGSKLHRLWTASPAPASSRPIGSARTTASAA